MKRVLHLSSLTQFGVFFLSASFMNLISAAAFVMAKAKTWDKKQNMNRLLSLVIDQVIQ